MDTPLQVGLWACGVWEVSYYWIHFLVTSLAWHVHFSRYTYHQTLDTPPSFVPCSVAWMSREGERWWYAGVREMEAVTCSSYWRGGEEGVRRWEAIVVYSFMQYFWVGSLWKKVRWRFDFCICSKSDFYYWGAPTFFPPWLLLCWHMLSRMYVLIVSLVMR